MRIDKMNPDYQDFGYANLLNLYNLADDTQKTEGARWYNVAHEIACELAGYCETPLVVGAGILAALSPSSQWERNISDAWQLVTKDTVSFQTQANRDKAFRIKYNARNVADIETILGNGEKTRDFFNAILNPTVKYGRPVIDSHTASAFFGYKLSERERSNYIFAQSKRGQSIRELIRREYYRLARDKGITAYQAQAIVWLVWRENAQPVTNWLPVEQFAHFVTV